ncbi:TIGR02680 family protein [Nocardia terpenica]|uniref:TIGR02680 family protein n=1 Tax=Nocardia terpenica TaxID=455432 RepID=UPI0018955992|nr:TIGR02680 family protein [Nocardia terpenica]MBF6064373.1 TIGR02680 family protein [Nocardia terpenica]MBF6106706.1 TIGR02680 family protein [Nocardia terpenica]MBF6113991.1 TIGR02680 family protein [Nocardia terpenica]MBF6120385.1 TIGR02680 family protein [Nocardia terpenica]MBF6157179.1 TIGR02680 family protein [Nocardia terpenica]
MDLIHGGVRFVPTRAGIVNLWDYRDQEFCFADGRLVLRGPNGSGKTKALEVLFPFVFDGRIEPRRLNPFAGEERTMKSNLLYRKQESAYSYVWMEFARGRWSDPEIVTVGIGMRATKSNDKVTRWYFVADGRVGVDFSLIGPDDRPLTRKQLAEQIGTDAIVDRPVDYRAAIDARMFGLGIQRYDQLINLILTLRRPQLAKNLDPRGLSQALTDGLRPLDEQLILDAARSFSDMEEVGRTLEGLVQADTATRAFVDVYRKYLGVQAKSDVDQVRARLDAVNHASTALFAATALRERRESERGAAEVRAEEADRAYEQALSDRETLQRSSAYEGKQQLDDLADAVRRLETSAAVHRDKATKARQAVDQRADEAERARGAVESAAAALARGEEELRAAAEEAGIAWAALPEQARGDQLTTTVRSHAEERDADVRAVRQALTLVDAAAADRTRTERAAQRATEGRDTAAAALAEAEAAVTLARADTAAALRDWWERHREIHEPVRAGLFEALDAALADAGTGDAPTLAEVLSERTEPLTEQIRTRRQQARAAAEQATARAAALRAEQQQVAAEKDDAPPPFAARTDDRTGRTGAPLWRLVRFADSVTPEQAAGLEAALQAANLLDAWVSADSPPPHHNSDQFLIPLPPGQRPSGRTLADVLAVEENSESLTVPHQAVADILASIALSDTNSPGGTPPANDSPGDTFPGEAGAPVSVAADGRYRQGVQVGRHTKPHAEFIGATARARRRELRLADLAGALEEAEQAGRAARAEEESATEALSRISAAAKALPRTSAVTAALRAVSEAAGVLRSRSEAAAQSERDLDQAVAEFTAADKKVRSVAATHRAPRDPGELDALAAAIRHFENTGTALLRLRGDQLREAERAREADDRMAESRDLAEAFAEEAEAARTGYEEQLRKLETLREALGAGAADIDRELEQARERIEAARAEQKSARKAAADAIEGVGTAEGAYRAAHDALGTALTELLADVKHLAPYARPDLLSLLGAPEDGRWPASEAAWSTPEQLLYRIETGGPRAEPRVLPDEVHELFESLSAATASVRAGEAARKSTRSAVTAALQEFDAALAAARQDYRLQWDAADGLTVVQVHDDQGVAALADFADRIARARADQELLLTDAERRILEDALLTGLAQQIHERTCDARDLITRMGSEMKQRRMSSGNTIGVHWVLADNLSESARAVCKLLDRDASDLGPDDLATIRAQFAAEIRAARAAHPERSYPEILATTLDYRTWRVFSFTLITADGTEDRLTVARHSALSGGEQSVSLHLPLFAAAHVMLDSADPQAPRLLALDEAFAGVDDNGRSELLGLSVDFDLDLFMTGYDLWITYDHVPACAHYDLAHSAAENTVSATLLVWDSKDLLAEHDGSDLTEALGSPNRRRTPHTVEGGITFDEAMEPA